MFYDEEPFFFQGGTKTSYTRRNESPRKTRIYQKRTYGVQFPCITEVKKTPEFVQSI